MIDDTKLLVSGNQLLSAPLTGPIRPLSPDTLSILSAEEYEQLQPGGGVLLPHEQPFSDSGAPGWRNKLREFWIRNLGLVYMLVAQVFGTLMNVTIRFLEIEGNHGKGLHPFQILFARMAITFTLSTAWMWYHRTPSFPFGIPEVRWLLIARGFGGFFGVFGMYYSLLYLPLADATVITFLAPGLACFACSILINEPFTRAEQIGGLVSLIGVVLIARPVTLFESLSAGIGQSASHIEPSSSNSSRADTLPSDASNYDNVTPTERLR